MIEQISKLPIYLRHNVSKDIKIGSLVVNPNVDFKVYKVLIISNKHMIVIDEKLVLHKFKIKNFVSVNYVFDIQSNIITSEKISHTTLKVSKEIFDICNNIILKSKENCYKEIFENTNIIDINEKFYTKIDSKIVVSFNKNESTDFHNNQDMSVSWLDHYATIKCNDSNEKIYFSFARRTKIYRK
jgi:hypothetical protein